MRQPQSSLWMKILSEAAASILGMKPHEFITILQLEDTDSNFQPWSHNSDDPLGINWFLIEETLKKANILRKNLVEK
ncbi:hypothetical protein TBCH5v1_1339 [Thermococcus barophilus]|uniref:Uncharacterized protein n=1 Tax=Thermococcus barophilus TaxID=55802 RepID=A0A0S1XC05_THEBA|nr:hypothetical protein TBCH5v1_1339 [Thermococcus barophilus]